MSLKPDDFVHSSRSDAIYALKRVGAVHDERLDLEGEIEGYGKVGRIYGFLGNVLELEGQIEAPWIADRLRRLIKDVDNEFVYDRMLDGRMHYTPANKRVVRRIADELVSEGLHLPWTWRPMNFDFGATVAAAHRKQPLPFLVFYSQQANFSSDGVSASRVFSLPIEGLAQGTWQEPIQDEILDPDVGLFFEANFRM